MDRSAFVAVGFLITIAALAENILLYIAYTPARRYYTAVQAVHDSSYVIEYSVVHWVQPSY